MLGNVASTGVDDAPGAADDPQLTKLRKALEALVISPDESEGPPKEGDWFRASSFGKLCGRMTGLAKEHGHALWGDVDGDLQYLFSCGNGIHHAFQNELISSALPKVFQGWWRCKSVIDRHIDDDGIETPIVCNRLHKGPEMPGVMTVGSLGWRAKPVICEGGGCPGPFAYEELEFMDVQLRSTGHCDGVLVWSEIEPGAPTEVLELKSINQFAFPYVNPMQGDPGIKPKIREDHKAQDYGYMHFTGLKHCRHVYVNKAGKNLEEALGEWRLEWDEEWWRENVESRLAASIRAVDAPMGSDIQPKLDACRGRTSKRAKYCPMLDICIPKRVKKK